METCPICHKPMVVENRNIDTMSMAYNYQYIVYSCNSCAFVVDFSIDGDISLAVVSEAFRKMAGDLDCIHRGGCLDASLLNRYKSFAHSKEFSACMKLWERNKTSFWEANKHLMIYVNNE